MFRPYLYQLAGDEYLFLHVVPHIAVDGWSVGVLYRDLSCFYNAIMAGETPQLPELPIQYADFAAWQRAQGQVLEAQLGYWRKQLSGMPSRLALPT